ncbi:MAG: hypothetical protein Faunusvirus16_14 [Faunusvirus sp.]|uniref:Uncharacterized protein n=1 Tax=Faunusvirus sp. TaxID=2487766 RepID=A0A3G4ZXA2_9VIRU|nr:MAG: hypothetical protein Faunusvirus16_14 [Faunusvirus sp.]
MELSDGLTFSVENKKYQSAFINANAFIKDGESKVNSLEKQQLLHKTYRAYTVMIFGCMFIFALFVTAFMRNYNLLQQDIVLNDAIKMIHGNITDYNVYSTYCTDGESRQVVCYRGDILVDNSCIYNKVTANTRIAALRYLTQYYPRNSSYIINYNTITGKCDDRIDLRNDNFFVWGLCFVSLILSGLLLIWIIFSFCRSIIEIKISS